MVIMESIPLNNLSASAASTPRTTIRRLPRMAPRINIREKDTLVVILSAAYAKLLIAMGIAYPISEVISPYIKDSFYVGFYLYLYLVSISFLIYTYAFLLGKKRKLTRSLVAISRKISFNRSFRSTSGDSEDTMRERKKVPEIRNCGSFYLRVGAIAFGIGSMIYSGLEFVQFFELGANSECQSFWDAVKPFAHMAFTFIQLYFIFLNSKMCIDKYQIVARFGLMHMVATNLCVWLLMIVQESKHEILHLTQHDSSHHHSSEAVSHSDNFTAPQYDFESIENDSSSESVEYEVHERERRATLGVRDAFQLCQRQNILGQLVQDASPFLFPCTIEYSLICAAVAYIMWKNIGKATNKRTKRKIAPLLTPAHRHQYTVDCTHTMRGLFTGILVLVAAIISVILFYVFINRPEYRTLAVVEAHVSELVLFSFTTVTVFIAMLQIRRLPYNPHRNIELDSILLIVAQLGVYFFSIFSIISGHLSDGAAVPTLVVLTSFARLFQATCQTIFILDASQRCATTGDQVRRKPGREMITFLLVCNFAMWIIKTMKTGRAEANPVQLEFYGLWGWTIIARVSTPLAIFFRFHSTVCLCEIWKKLYKLKKPDSAIQETENNNHNGSVTPVSIGSANCIA